MGLSIEAIRGGFSASFVTAYDLVTDLGKAACEGKLERRLRAYLHPKVLGIDEVGSLPLDDLAATLLFQLISARYERGSILLTRNKSYGEWGQIFGEHTLATAILDRLLHPSTTLKIRGESYRLKERRKAGLLAVPPARDRGRRPPAPEAGPEPEQKRVLQQRKITDAARIRHVRAELREEE